MNTKKEAVIYLTLASVLGLGATQVQAQIGNTAYGQAALFNLTTGSSDSAFGESALRNTTTGSYNTASGYYSLGSNTTGNANTASGYFSAYANTTGSYNTASGYYSLYANTTGSYNTASGYLSLRFNTTGYDNTASGYASLLKNTTGIYNTAFGDSALFSNTLGSGNAAQGRSALYSNLTGEGNIGIGNLAGFVNSVGNNNIFIGRGAGFYETTSNNLYIGNSPTSTLLYGKMSSTAANQKLGIGTITVAAGDAIAVWNGAHLTRGGVWTNASSRELKDNIEILSTEDANAALADLSPVRYVYRNSRDEEYVGFIAEDVPALVAANDRKSLSPMDIVAVLTTVTKEQKAEVAALNVVTGEQAVKLTEKDAEIADLKDRMLQMEMALAEVLRKQSSAMQVGLIN